MGAGSSVVIWKVTDTPEAGVSFPCHLLYPFPNRGCWSGEQKEEEKSIGMLHHVCLNFKLAHIRHMTL